MTESAKKTVINLGIVLLISIACTFYFGDSNFNLMSILMNVLYGSIVGLSIAFGCALISRIIFRRESVYENPTKHFVLAIVSVTLFLIVDVIVINYIWFSITQGISFSDLFGNKFGVYAVTIEFTIGLLIYLVALARFFTRDLKKYYAKTVEAESQLAKYRYDTLKNQLNPHFLFNSLNTLSGLIYIDVDRADQFIHRLSKLYRYILEMQQVEVVAIETEMELVNDYLYLNNIRFNNQIKTNISVNVVDGYIAPMALQLLIENAIKHNTISEAAPLNIEIRIEGNDIVVRNNIQLKQEKEPSTELGLNNLHERYETLTDRKLVVEQSDAHFTVRVPILETETV